MKKIISRIRFYCKIRLFQYLYLNYFCKNIIRTDQSRIIPYAGAVMEMEPGAKVYLGGGDIELGCDRLKGSKTETFVRIRRDAVWSSEGGCRIAYGSTVEILCGGLLDSGFFSMNSGSIMIAAKRIRLGRNVMIGRGVVIYDSDHHTIRNLEGKLANLYAPVEIGDHVWLATNVMVLKGSTIGSGSMIAANAMVSGSVPPDCMYRAENTAVIRKNYGVWSREHPQE